MIWIEFLAGAGLIVLLDILCRSGPLLQKVYPGHVLSAGLGVIRGARGDVHLFLIPELTPQRR
jgi:hypothetical protein